MALTSNMNATLPTRQGNVCIGGTSGHYKFLLKSELFAGSHNDLPLAHESKNSR